MQLLSAETDRSGSTLSVIMGVRRRNADIRNLCASVASILSQTYPVSEFVICDDGSDAATRYALDAMAQQDSRVHVIRTGADGSLAAKLNLCLSVASGELIARQDDDDLSLPDRFSRQVSFLRDHPGFSFVGCNAVLFDSSGDYGTVCFPEYPAVADFLFKQPYLHPALVFRAAALKAVGGYCAEARTVLCEDYDLLLRMYEAGMTGANLQDNLFRYRVQRGQENRTMRHRWNECRTRLIRFRTLGLLPGALPYVVKPLAVGLIPAALRQTIKQKTRNAP